MNSAHQTQRAPSPRWRRLVGSSFVRDASVMMIGTTAGQMASLLLAPILTRLFTVEEFGYLGVYTAALAILGVAAALGFDLAIPLAASDAELMSLTAACGIAVAFTTALVGLAAWLAPTEILTEVWLGPLDAYRYLLPLGLACLGGYYVVVAAATRLGRFNEIARTRLSQGLGGPLSQIGFGWLGLGFAGLAIGTIIGQASGFFLLLSRVVLDRPIPRAALTWTSIRAVAWRYRHFPLFASWGRVVDMAGSGPVLYLLFSTYYSTAIVGYMFLGERVFARPLLMVSSSLLQVFAGEAGRTARLDPNTLRRRFRQVVLGQFAFALGWIALVNIAAPWAVPKLFGAPWIAAVPYLRALSLSYLALAVLHPVSSTLQLINRQALAAAWQVARLVLTVGAAVLAHDWHWSGLAAIWLCSAVQLFACLGILATMALCIVRMTRKLTIPADVEAACAHQPCIR